MSEPAKRKFSFLFAARISVGFLLSACTTDSVPDEEFEAPTGNFPLLGTVPDRPVFQPSQDVIRQQERLEQEHAETLDKQAKIAQSLTP